MNPEIKFGTDGWRGIIAEDFTFENVRRVAQALADYLGDRGEERKVAVGYDFRFMSEDFARTVSEVLAGNGVQVFLSPDACPTPHVSYWVQRQGLPLGVMITASHNPYRYNGFKVKERYGGSARPETTQAITDLLGRSPVKSTPIDEALRTGSVVETRLDEGYERLIESLVDIPAIRGSSLKVVADSMNGVGAGLLESWGSSPTCRIKTIRADRDPLFGGLAPEPKWEFMEPLRQAVLDEKADVGLATDGDADRSGGVHPNGDHFTPLEMISLLAIYLIEEKGSKGAIASNNANTLYLKKIAEAYGLPYVNLPVGFKYIADLMQKERVLIGGEESGGIAIDGFLPERDGIMINLLLLEMLARRGKSTLELLQELYGRFGEFHFRRRDFPMEPPIGKAKVAALSKAHPEHLQGKRVVRVDTLDGAKFFLEDDSWILFRQSGTEPSLRVYGEAPTKQAIHDLIEEGVEVLKKTEI